MRHHNAFASLQLPSSRTAPSRSRSIAAWSGRRLAVTIEGDDIALEAEGPRPRRAEIEHRPAPRIGGPAQRPRQIRPGQPDHQRGPPQHGDRQRRGRQASPSSPADAAGSGGTAGCRSFRSLSICPPLRSRRSRKTRGCPDVLHVSPRRAPICRWAKCRMAQIGAVLGRSNSSRCSCTSASAKRFFRSPGWAPGFLPATKAMPKEMLPIVDKPLIHYAVEEAKAAGIEQFFFVTSRAKSAIDDHFDRAFELEATLRERGKTRLVEELEVAAARTRPDRLYTPTDAARARPRGVVRARTGRRRAFCRAAGRRFDGVRHALSGADGRGL